METTAPTITTTNTTFGLLASNEALAPVSSKRNRHTVENDLQSALIKRINRHYVRLNIDRKVIVIDGQPALIVASSGIVAASGIVRTWLPGSSLCKALWDSLNF